MEEIYELEARKLQEAVADGREVKIHIVNGYRMEAVILDFDCNVILCRSGGKERMVYRHAVSTISFD